MSFNLPLYKNFGSEIKELSPTLSNQLSQMYTDIANALSQAIKKDVVTGADPAASAQRNSFFSVGDITVRTDTDSAWIMTSRTTPNDVVWTLIT
jgi:hypothetical protein